MRTISSFLLEHPRLAITKKANENDPYTIKYIVGDVEWDEEEMIQKGIILTLHNQVVDNPAESVLEIIVDCWLNSLKDDNEEDKD